MWCYFSSNPVVIVPISGKNEQHTTAKYIRKTVLLSLSPLHQIQRLIHPAHSLAELRLHRTRTRRIQKLPLIQHQKLRQQKLPQPHNLLRRQRPHRKQRIPQTPPVPPPRILNHQPPLPQHPRKPPLHHRRLTLHIPNRKKQTRLTRKLRKPPDQPPPHPGRKPVPRKKLRRTRSRPARRPHKIKKRQILRRKTTPLLQILIRTHHLPLLQKNPPHLILRNRPRRRTMHNPLHRHNIPHLPPQNQSRSTLTLHKLPLPQKPDLTKRLRRNHHIHHPRTIQPEIPRNQIHHRRILQIRLRQHPHLIQKKPQIPPPLLLQNQLQLRRPNKRRLRMIPVINRPAPDNTPHIPNRNHRPNPSPLNPDNPKQPPPKRNQPEPPQNLPAKTTPQIRTHPLTIHLPKPPGLPCIQPHRLPRPIPHTKNQKTPLRIRKPRHRLQIHRKTPPPKPLLKLNILPLRNPPRKNIRKNLL